MCYGLFLTGKSLAKDKKAPSHQAWSLLFAPISRRRLLRASHKTQLKKARSLNVGVKQQIRE